LALGEAVEGSNLPLWQMRRHI